MKLRPMMAIVLAASAASLVVTAASAQPNDPNWVQRDKFRSLDKDGDGYLTKKEVSQFGDYGQAFDKADENRDGKLTVEEFIQAEATYDRHRVAAYAGDAAITAKVKTALIRERDLSSMDINVETSEGRVMLAGWVKDDSQRKRAVEVAQRVEGVKEVKDRMMVR
ncbi:MAG TPA: BON domain-containing protein [Burkholderiales bacterium]|nr:BON domain-containing protein [Burkholderiales bacterium]